MQSPSNNKAHNGMSDEEIKLFIANSSWVFAKSMPETPHEYTARRKAKDVAMFERFVLHIRKHGYRKKFGKYAYTYLDLDGWQYWTMGWPVRQTVIINRAKLSA